MMQPRLRVLSWNINSGVLPGVDPTPRQIDESISYIVNCIQKLSPDLVALQEVSFPPAEASPSQAMTISRMARLDHVAQWRLSSSHLIQGFGLGSAILSRFPIIEERRDLLPNPRLTLKLDNGKLLESHDKGLLNVKIASKAGPIWFVCGHMLPFHRFHCAPTDSEFAAIWAAVSSTLLELAESPMLGCFDFNTDQLSTLLPQCFASGRVQALIHQPTRPTGEQHDQIICSADWSDQVTKVLTSRLDHYPCLAELSLEPKTATIAASSPRRNGNNKCLILHLSDLHFGAGEAGDVDWKTFVPYATRQTRRDRLLEFLRALPKVPDYVVISGDITIAGREDGYVLFIELMDQLISAGALPSPERIIVVPGNHDVARVRDEFGANARWTLFMKYVGNRFVRPWLQHIDREPQEILQKLDTMIDRDGVLGGVDLALDRKLGTMKTCSFPFVWDRSRGILIYAFNSASISGVRIAMPVEIETQIRWLRDWNDPNRGKVLEVLDALERELWVDPARIDPQEITLFNSIMDRLRSKDAAGLEASLKIAVLHHHVAPVIPEEVTKFEFLLNAGRFKKELTEEGFRVVLHGHKHWPAVLRDSAPPGEEPRYVISGGTIGGAAATGRRPGFFLLECGGNPETVSTRYIQLEESGNPRKSMEREREDVLGLGLETANRDLWVHKPSPISLCLPDLLQVTERSLLSCLRNQASPLGTEWFGWSHALDDDRVSVVATAYGLRILSVTHLSTRSLPHCLPQVLNTLLALRHKDGGWHTSSQSGATSRVEPTAFALSALHSWNRWREVEDGCLTLNRLLEPTGDPVFWQHVYSLATVGRILAEIDPMSSWLPTISNVLIEAAYRNAGGKILYWGRLTLREAGSNIGWMDNLGNVLHTAHALCTLCRIHKATDGRAGVAPNDLREACDWLLLCDDWSNAAEDINRPVELGKYDKLATKHFTLPWVILALLEAGVNPSHSRIRGGIQELMRSHSDGLWNWGPMERPIWATHDAISALVAFALGAAEV